MHRKSLLGIEDQAECSRSKDEDDSVTVTIVKEVVSAKHVDDVRSSI